MVTINLDIQKDVIIEQLQKAALSKNKKASSSTRGEEFIIKINNLQVSEKLSNFVNDELLKNKDTTTEVSLRINFSNSDSSRIKSYQKKNDLKTPSDAVVDLVLEGLETHGE